MSITEEQMYYTWLSQGVPGIPQKLKATQIASKTFPPNPLLPAMPPKTIDVYTTQPYSIIARWNNDTEFYAFCNSGLEVPFFYPKNDVNDIYVLTYKGRSGGVVVINAKKEDNTIVTTYTTSIEPLTYQANSVGDDSQGIEKRYPVYLTVYAKEINSAKKIGFGIAAGFSDMMGVNNYPSAKNYLYDCGVGDISSPLSYMMLDESMIIDDGGGAPTGDEDGGGGLFDYPFTPIGEPALPTVSICDTGMISLYTVSPSDMYQLAQKLWSQNFFDTIIKNFQSPMDNIVSLHVVPFNVYAATQNNIIIGNYDTEIPSNLLTTTYFVVDCGIIELTGAYQTFADYAPFTNLALYLPYIGIVPISPDDIMDGAINVKYHIDVFSGACVAFVMSLKRGQWTVLNQYQGNILTQFPITGADYTNVYVGAMQVANTAIQTGMQIATAPSAVNAVSNGLNGITQGFSQAMQAKPSFQRSGNVTSAAGFMSVQIPYLIITKPNYIQAKDFRALKGYVSNLQCVIGEQSGFISATVNNEKLTGFNATDEEKNMIRSLLSEGIYI